MLLTRLDGVYYRSDLASAYNQVPLSEDAKKLTSFVVGGKQYMFERGFYGLCGLPNFLVASWQSILLKWLPRSKLSHILMMWSFK